MHIHQTHHGTERARTRENESARARVRENTNRNDRVLSASRNAANSIAVAKREEKEFAKKKAPAGRRVSIRQRLLVVVVVAHGAQAA